MSRPQDSQGRRIAVVLFNPGESATKLSFDLVDAGFAPDTRVHVMLRC